MNSTRIQRFLFRELGGECYISYHSNEKSPYLEANHVLALPVRREHYKSSVGEQRDINEFVVFTHVESTVVTNFQKKVHIIVIYNEMGGSLEVCEE